MSSERSPAVGRLLSEAAWPRNYRAIAFQERRRLARCGALQVHLTLYPLGSFRTGNIDGDDCHFAFRTDDFDGALATLIANGFHEGRGGGRPDACHGPAGATMEAVGANEV